MRTRRRAGSWFLSPDPMRSTSTTASAVRPIWYCCTARSICCVTNRVISGSIFPGTWSAERRIIGRHWVSGGRKIISSL
eukprot:29754_4